MLFTRRSHLNCVTNRRISSMLPAQHRTQEATPTIRGEPEGTCNGSITRVIVRLQWPGSGRAQPGAAKHRLPRQQHRELSSGGASACSAKATGVLHSSAPDMAATWRGCQPRTRCTVGSPGRDRSTTWRSGAAADGGPVRCQQQRQQQQRRRRRQQHRGWCNVSSGSSGGSGSRRSSSSSSSSNSSSLHSTVPGVPPTRARSPARRRPPPPACLCHRAPQRRQLRQRLGQPVVLVGGRLPPQVEEAHKVLHAAPARHLVQRRAPGLVGQQSLHQADDKGDLSGGGKGGGRAGAGRQLEA